MEPGEIEPAQGDPARAIRNEEYQKSEAVKQARMRSKDSYGRAESV